ncbi:HAD family hydrolase [Litoreibacter roseus]|uniref:Haloacid dehalogenase n=1 Tax=Litoreibacter roseus TaxID=2601869 RepID=A0A6N6JDK2_9RHOB|nr:HAD-IA family hydrolase [Litoreibacter roseus]GFE63388.1 haloacid dehalogenase [Litoreibacter roseus]
MAKCLMLDVDGVLIDGRPEDAQRWDHTLYTDLGVAPEDLGRIFFARDWPDIIIGKADLKPALADALIRLQASVTAQELIDYWFAKDARIVVPVLSDVRAARASGLPVYLATNQEHLRADHLMTAMGLGAEVDGMIYSAAAGFRKPQPEFYSYARKVTGVEPHEMLLVDDTPANVEGALAAGWDAILWDESAQLSEILQNRA